MKLTCKFVKSILPKKVRKYVCKDWCGSEKQVWVNFAFWDITEDMKKESFKAFKKNGIKVYNPSYANKDGYFLFRKGE